MPPRDVLRVIEGLRCDHCGRPVRETQHTRTSYTVDYYTLYSGNGEVCSFTGEDGIERCRIVLENSFIPTRWQPKRPFQGWRYLTIEDAPPDASDTDGDALPLQLQRELAELGLL